MILAIDDFNERLLAGVGGTSWDTESVLAKIPNHFILAPVQVCHELELCRVLPWFRRLARSGWFGSGCSQLGRVTLALRDRHRSICCATENTPEFSRGISLVCDRDRRNLGERDDEEWCVVKFKTRRGTSSAPSSTYLIRASISNTCVVSSRKLCLSTGRVLCMGKTCESSLTDCYNTCD